MDPQFLEELDRNFERVCVMEQRQFITMKLEREADVPSQYLEYARAVEEFNAAFDDHKAFETSYCLSLENRTRANAVILDQKNDMLQQKFLKVRKLLARP